MGRMNRIRHIYRTYRRHCYLAVLAALCAGFIMILNATTAFACHACGCVNGHRDNTISVIRNEHGATKQFITDEFVHHQNWLFGANNLSDRSNFFRDHALPAMMMMTEQLVVNAMHQMLVIGTFFDAKNQIETQRIYQVKAAQAHKDYLPSFEMCIIGTNTRSLAAAHRNNEFTRYVLGRRSLERGLGMHAQASAYDPAKDREARLHQYVTRYCDPHDNNNALSMLCSVGTPNRYAVNKDIDFARTVDSVKTLKIDFTDNDDIFALDSDERDVMALAANIYNSDTMERFADIGDSMTHGDQMSYHEIRSIVAKRNVIENSFNAIVGLKAAGSEQSMMSTMEFARQVLNELGVTDPNEQRYLLGGNSIQDLGGSDSITPQDYPSYYAQMELLAQKIYQSPDFFVGLYDKPANVKRKDVAMQAIGLMLNRDMFESELRSEMTMAVMLELEIMKYQMDIQNRINSLVDE